MTIDLTFAITSLRQANTDLETAYEQAIHGLGGYHSLALGVCDICFEVVSQCTCYQGCTNDCYDEDEYADDPRDYGWSRGPQRTRTHDRRSRAW
jgi:hypothetical protein